MTKTTVQATKPVDKEKAAEAKAAEAEKNAVSGAVTDVLQSVSELSYDERKDFFAKFKAAFNEENDLRSGGKDFDAAKYNA